MQEMELEQLNYLMKSWITTYYMIESTAHFACCLYSVTAVDKLTMYTY